MKIELPIQYRVACHTDNVGVGSTFVAIKGTHSDGVDFIPQALEHGATTIVIEQSVQLADTVQTLITEKNTKVVRVPNTRTALATLSAQAYNYPAQKLTIVGITGTKGKTTTCFLLEHILRTAGHKTALISSAQNRILDIVFSTSLTTPHPDFLHMFFDAAVHAGVTHVVMEVAAQALSLGRIETISFDSIVFTNFDREHGEFYPTMDDYFAAKCAIFKHAKSHAFLLGNYDDMQVRQLYTTYPMLTYFSLQKTDCAYPATATYNTAGITLYMHDILYHCPALLGLFNSYNMLAAVIAAHKLGVAVAHIQHALQTFTGTPGRLERYQLPNNILCCIDNAHNPSSFHAILSTLRSLTNHLIVIFGAGGDRDRVKRPIMGAIAAQYADQIYITSDNPRSEDPALIIEAVYAGVPSEARTKTIIDIDRERVIRTAYHNAPHNAIIALLGKGADEYQLINGVKQYFSERAIIEALRNSYK